MTITVIHREFARRVANGVKPAEAYGGLHPCCEKKCWVQSAHRWMKKPEIQQLIDYYRARIELKAEEVKSDLYKFLSDIVADEEQPLAERLKASAQLIDIYGLKTDKRQVELRASAEDSWFLQQLAAAGEQKLLAPACGKMPAPLLSSQTQTIDV